MINGATLAWSLGAAVSAFCLVQGLRTGTAGSAMTRAASPTWFWCSMVFFAISTAAMTYQALIDIYRGLA